MTIALGLKIIGGLLAAGGHRTLLRAAREESFGWWMFAMFCPGGSIFYGLRDLRTYGRVLGVIVAGLAVVGAGFGVGLFQEVQRVSALQAANHAAGAGHDAADDDDDDQGRSAVLASTASAAPAPDAAHALATNTAPAPLPTEDAVPPRMRPQLKKLLQRYESLSRERAALDIRNPDAVRSFNLKAEDYRAACQQFSTDLAAR